MKDISPNGIKFIKSFEGCYLTAYDDLQPKVKLTPNTPIKGTLTIGWGHTGNVKIGQTITREQADYLLVNDLKRYIAYTNDEGFVPMTKRLNQNQFDALVSFCYNCGPSNLKKLCYNYSISDIPKNIILYNKSKGNLLMGLVRRRQAEKELFLKEVTPETIKEVAKIDEKIIKELQSQIYNLQKDLSKVMESTKEIPIPKWLTNEFPNALAHINHEKGSYEFWRGVLISLRLNDEISTK